MAPEVDSCRKMYREMDADSHGEIDGVATSFMDFDCVTNARSELRDTRTVALSTWDYTLRLLTSPSW